MSRTPPDPRPASTIVAEIAAPEVLDRRGAETLECLPITGSHVTGAPAGPVVPADVFEILA